MNGILETETCTCIQQFKERIKEDKKVNYVDCENEGFIFDNRKHEHDFENLYITFIYANNPEMKRKKRISLFFSYCPICGKKVKERKEKENVK